MKYRLKRKMDKPVSELGLGPGTFHLLSYDEIRDITKYAIDNGMNIIDLITVDETPFKPIADAIKDCREDIQLQVHIGAAFPNGQTDICRDLDEVKAEFEKMLEIFDTDYMDIGLIHMVDDMDDFNAIMDSGIWDYLIELKRTGKVKKMGFCSHSLEIAKAFLATGLVDCFMLSVNPVYDFVKEDGVLSISKERMDFYRECEAKGIAIHIMKSMAGGSLLNKETSQLKTELSVYQCVQYGLDRPGIATSIVGVSNMEELKHLLNFYDAKAEDKDYSVLNTLNSDFLTKGNCIYCNHCQPCSEGIDIGIMNKYYDLATIGDELAKKHYFDLRKHASDCIYCGECDERCPFDVNPSERIDEILDFFGQ